jgi:hypothetical protein
VLALRRGESGVDVAHRVQVLIELAAVIRPHARVHGQGGGDVVEHALSLSIWPSAPRIGALAVAEQALEGGSWVDFHGIGCRASYDIDMYAQV